MGLTHLSGLLLRGVVLFDSSHIFHDRHILLVQQIELNFGFCLSQASKELYFTTIYNCWNFHDTLIGQTTQCKLLIF